MTRTLITMITVGTLISASGMAADKENKEDLKPQTVCPVMGGKISKQSYVDHDGQRVYFCCRGCEAVFRKDPEKHLKTMADKGEKPATLQTKCPIMGGKINKAIFVDHDGLRIYLCCAGCDVAFNKDPAKYIKQMKVEGVVLTETPKEDKNE